MSKEETYEIVRNPISDIPVVKMPVDDLSDLPYRVTQPLPAKSFAMYICGQPGSGKTTTWVSLLTSRPTKACPTKPRYYYRYFDRIHLISGSVDTLPLDKLRLNPERLHTSFDDDLLVDIVQQEREDENLNNLIILDDVIKDLKNSKALAKVILNRRHCTQDKDKDNQAGLSIMITSQVYNLLPLGLRKNMSHVILFRTENKRELDSIKSELMSDLSDSQANKVLRTAWSKPHGFLFIACTKPTRERYHANFSRIII